VFDLRQNCQAWAADKSDSRLTWGPCCFNYLSTVGSSNRLLRADLTPMPLPHGSEMTIRDLRHCSRAVEDDGYGVLAGVAAVGEPGGIVRVAAGLQRSYRVERADSG
jgi:hypothetical protein